MTLGDFITKGVAAKGTVRELATFLGVGATALSAAKNNHRTLPNHACFKLAVLIGEDASAIVAASELVTEDNPERRAVFIPFARAAVVVVATIATGLGLAPKPVYANDTLFVSTPVDIPANKRLPGQSVAWNTNYAALPTAAVPRFGSWELSDASECRRTMPEQHTLQYGRIFTIARAFC